MPWCKRGSLSPVRCASKISDLENDKSKDVWGQIEEDYIYIVKSKFDQILNDNGFSSEAFLSWAKHKGLLKSEEGRRTIRKRIVNINMRCVGIKNLPNEQQ